MTRFGIVFVVAVVATVYGLPVMEDVVILDAPQSGYVIKSRPYQLSCKALNAKKIRFKCNNRWLDESRYETILGTDPTSQIPFLESSVEITRQEIETGVHLEDYSCQCYASGTSDEHVVRSDPVKVKIAYMRKHFMQSPTSERVPEGSTVQFPCIAPESDPKAQLVWLKDGIEIERSTDSNLIYANDGSLIISAARLTDSGNYTCQATNLANSRNTDSAALYVYVNGGWSSWGDWNGVCSTDCELLRLQLNSAPSGVAELPMLRRTRTCNNPAPLNGGEYCSGNEEESRPCNITCRIDGQWSGWDEWSPCSQTCERFRSRTCTAPNPMNGGRSCTGKALETGSCPESFCQPIAMENASLAGYAAVYGGIICVFLVLLLILALCTIVVCKKNRKLKKNEKFYYGETLNHMRNGLLEQQQKALLSDEKKIPPHSSQFFTMSNICSPSPMHPSMTMRSAKSGYSGYSANRNAGSRAALITECSSSNSSSGGGKRALVRTSSNCSDDENYATLYDYMDEKSAVGLENSQSILAAQVDSAGARLQLRLGGASLLIPENALLSERMIYLALSDLVSDRPQLQPGESALSPVVMVGECSSDSDRSDDARRVLRKPMVVSFRHCASVFPRDNWTFSLYADEGFGWRKVVTLGEENLNTTVHVHMDPIGKGKGSQMGWCHVMTDNFSRMMLVGRSRRPSVTACKRAHLAAYGPAHRPDGDFELRIYCVPETGAAMENVSRQEENARLLAESDHFILNENGDLCFCIEDITEGFQIQGSPVVEIPSSSHQWCAQNGLHCSLHFTSDGRLPIEHFVSRLVVYQKTNPAERHLLQLRFEASIYDKPQPTLDKTVTVDFHLPAEVKEELAELLDPPSSPERDWRGLAKKLHFDRYVQFFATRPGCSPTSLLLDLWEAVECGSARAAPDLLQSLRVMGRPDAVLIIEEYLANFSYLMEP